ncbi:MAG: hypothetical protein M0C28_35690 [Candidatus Moduliflexus flocculans]|nr:hypothetical protein [Candidatus Moduliflexus flocculans]
MARYHIGTAGWSYEDWEGIVYPALEGPRLPRPALSRRLHRPRRGQQHLLPPGRSRPWSGRG